LNKINFTQSTIKMSAFTKNLVGRMAMVPRVMTTQVPRTFVTYPALHKTATQTVADTVKTVDRAVSDKIVDGLNAAGTFPPPNKTPNESPQNEMTNLDTQRMSPARSRASPPTPPLRPARPATRAPRSCAARPRARPRRSRARPRVLRRRSRAR
jgi:hypothetical protein